MTTDLKEQLSQYADEVDNSQEPVSFAEVVEQPLSVGPGSRIPGGWIGLGAAVVTLLVVGLGAWLLSNRDAVDPIDPPPSLTPVEGSNHFAPIVVPDGFVFNWVDARILGGAVIWYLRDTGTGVWLPSDGGFSVVSQGQVAIGPESDDADGAASRYMDDLLALSAGAIELDLDGQRAVLHEAQVNQGEVSTEHISLLVHAGDGVFFEVLATGMTRDEVITIAENTAPVSPELMSDLELTYPWTHYALFAHDDFDYQVPSVLDISVDDYEVVVGVDLLRHARLLPINDAEAKIESPRESSAGQAYITAVGSDPEMVQLNLDQTVDDWVVLMSPALAREQYDRFVDHVLTGEVVSEDPLIIQAPNLPAPDFAPDLGEELALQSGEVDAIAALFEMQEPGEWDAAVGSRQSPIVIGGTVIRPGTDTGPTLLIWETTGGYLAVGEYEEGSLGSSGSELAPMFGLVGWSDGPVGSAVTFSVPPSTHVVQILTRDGAYWQRPVGGFGLIPLSVASISEFIAWGEEGQELGRWRPLDNQ